MLVKIKFKSVQVKIPFSGFNKNNLSENELKIYYEYW